MTYEEVEAKLTEWGMMTYPSKVKFLHNALEKCPDKTLNFMLAIHGDMLQKLDLREAILADDKEWDEIRKNITK